MGQGVGIESVSKEFGGFKAVQNISLQVKEGELLTLLGPSDSGKTTLLLLIAGFHTPTFSKILIGEKPMTYVSPNKRNTGNSYLPASMVPFSFKQRFFLTNFGYQDRKKLKKEKSFQGVEALRDFVYQDGINPIIDQ